MPALISVPAAVDELIAALPKAELHVHLEGSMPPALLLELAQTHGVTGVPQSLEAIQGWYEFRDFAHFAEVYLTAVETLREDYLTAANRRAIKWSGAACTRNSL